MAFTQLQTVISGWRTKRNKLGKHKWYMPAAHNGVTVSSSLTPSTIFCFLFVLLTVNAEAKTNKYQAKASWYQSGSITADGSKYDPDGYSVAHRTLPFGTIVILTNPKTGKSIWAIVNDRGPYIKGRELDVSRGAAIALGFFHTGVAKLVIEVLEKNKQERRHKRKDENNNKTHLRKY